MPRAQDAPLFLPFRLYHGKLQGPAYREHRRYYERRGCSFQLRRTLSKNPRFSCGPPAIQHSPPKLQRLTREWPSSLFDFHALPKVSATKSTAPFIITIQRNRGNEKCAEAEISSPCQTVFVWRAFANERLPFDRCSTPFSRTLKRPRASAESPPVALL